MGEETKYKTGQKVTVRSDITVGGRLDGCLFADFMKPMLGRTVVVTRAIVNSHGQERYFIESFDCYLSNSMIEENQFIVELI